MNENEIIPANRSVKDKNTKTIYMNDNHLRLIAKERLLSGQIDLYSVKFSMLTPESQAIVKNYEPLGWKAVFVYGNKNVLLTYNK